jgi:hypothetical protein
MLGIHVDTAQPMPPKISPSNSDFQDHWTNQAVQAADRVARVKLLRRWGF